MNFKERALIYLNARNSQLHILHLHSWLLYSLYVNYQSLGGAIYAQAILTSALLSHHLAGGELVSGRKLLLGYLVIVFPLMHSDLKNFKGPQLAMTIVVVQSLGHFYFGLDSQSDLRMAIAHLLGGALCYGFISSSSIFLHAGSRLINSLFAPLSYKRLFFSDAPANIAQGSKHSIISFDFISSRGMRAPPFIEVSIG